MKSRRRNYLFAVLSTALFLLAQAVAADDRLRLPMPPLPPMPKGSLPTITLSVPPPIIWLPTQNVHVAYESPHPIFYIGGQYYLHHGDRWYLGPSHNGPWNVAKGKIPRSIRHFRHDHWGNYQREAVQQFREDRHGQHHHFYADRPHERASWREHERRSQRDGDRDDHRRHEGRGHDRHEQDDHRDNRHEKRRTDQHSHDDHRDNHRGDRDKYDKVNDGKQQKERPGKGRRDD